MASSPGRIRAESAAVAAGKSEAAICRLARSRRGSRETTAAVNSRPSQSCTRGRESRATCAFVTMVPSVVQITPEPAPRPFGWISTVDLRNCSAISPNPGAAISVPLPALADGQADLPHRAAANDLGVKLLADAGWMKLGVNVFESRNRSAGQRDENV